MTEHLNTTELAKRMGVSKGAVSQWVSAGKLDGCFEGSGRERRFDLLKVAERLDREIDIGQSLGNAAETTETARAILMNEAEGVPLPPREGGALRPEDPDRLRIVKTQKAEEDLRKARRDNESEEGNWVVRAEAERAARSLLSAELGLIEGMLTSASRKVADRLSVDARTVRSILRDAWREHRAARANAHAEAAPEARMSAIEAAADI